MGIFERLLGGRHGGGHGGGYGGSHGGSHGKHYRNDPALPSDNQWGRAPVTAPAVTLIACTACGAGSEAGSRFCAQCGAALTPSPSTCAGCGSALVNGVRFCSQCGKAR